MVTTDRWSPSIVTDSISRISSPFESLNSTCKLELNSVKVPLQPPHPAKSKFDISFFVLVIVLVPFNAVKIN